MGEVLKRTFVLTVDGLALGTVAAWMLTRVLASLFVGVSPHDPGISQQPPASLPSWRSWPRACPRFVRLASTQSGAELESGVRKTIERRLATGDLLATCWCALTRFVE